MRYIIALASGAEASEMIVYLRGISSGDFQRNAGSAFIEFDQEAYNQLTNIHPKEDGYIDTNSILDGVMMIGGEEIPIGRL